MSNLNERTCKNCNLQYAHKYEGKSGKLYHQDVEFCSKSCASKFRGPIGCILPDIGKADLMNKATAFIASKGHYCTGPEICVGVGHSNKTFSKHGVRLADLNRELGFDKPKSVFQNKVKDILKNKFGEVETEKCFDGLVGTKGHPLRVDFYIPEINTVVEADGSQHLSPDHPWAEWNNGTVMQYDAIKDSYFEERGIKLVRVPYKRKIKEIDVMFHLN